MGGITLEKRLSERESYFSMSEFLDSYYWASEVIALEICWGVLHFGVMIMMNYLIKQLQKTGTHFLAM